MNSKIVFIGVTAVIGIGLLFAGGVAGHQSMENPTEVSNADGNWFAGAVEYTALEQTHESQLGFASEDDFDEITAHQAYQVALHEQNINTHAEESRQALATGEIGALEFSQEMRHNALHEVHNDRAGDRVVERADEVGVEFSQDDLNELRLNASQMTPEQIRNHAHGIVSGTPAPDNPGNGR